MVNGIGEGSVAPSFQNCIFEENVSLGNGAGVARYGGSWVERVDFILCMFRKNISKASGGGCYYYDSERIDQLDFIECIFESNQSTKSGGGIQINLGRTENARFFIYGSNFRKNVSGAGGAAV